MFFSTFASLLLQIVHEQRIEVNLAQGSVAGMYRGIPCW